MNENRKDIRRARYARLTQAGYKSKDATRYKSLSDKKVDQLCKLKIAFDKASEYIVKNDCRKAEIVFYD